MRTLGLLLTHLTAKTEETFNTVYKTYKDEIQIKFTKTYIKIAALIIIKPRS